MTKPIKLALIEDEQPIIELYRLKFEDEGYEVTVAKNGLEGLELVRTIEPHILLLDIMMPKMTGLTMLEKLRESGVVMPKVIILTNMGYDEVIDRATTLGANDVFIKVDVTPSQIATRVRELVG